MKCRRDNFCRVAATQRDAIAIFFLFLLFWSFFSLIPRFNEASIIPIDTISNANHTVSIKQLEILQFTRSN